MADGPSQPTAKPVTPPTGTTATTGGMTRGIAHAITAVLAAFVAAFALLFLLARAQDETAAEPHPLDFLMEFYRASGIVETFVATALVWIAIFIGLSELLVATRPDRTRALRTAIVIEVVCFAGFVALWYLPL